MIKVVIRFVFFFEFSKWFFSVFVLGGLDV